MWSGYVILVVECILLCIVACENDGCSLNFFYMGSAKIKFKFLFIKLFEFLLKKYQIIYHNNVFQKNLFTD